MRLDAASASGGSGGAEAPIEGVVPVLPPPPPYGLCVYVVLALVFAWWAEEELFAGAAEVDALPSN